MKLLIYISTLLFLTACQENNTTKNEYKNTEINKDTTSFVIVEEEDGLIQIEEELEQKKQDSLKQLFNQLDDEYQTLLNLYHKEKSKLFTINWTTNWEYENCSKIWYFDSLLQLKYFIYDFGAEGGYGNIIFCKFQNNSLKFYRSITNEYEDKIDYLKNKDSTYQLTVSHINNYIDSVETPYYSEVEVSENLTYNKLLDTIPKTQFILDSLSNQYKYSNLFKIHDVYGMNELDSITVGDRITIDSVLLESIYKNKY